MTGKATANIGYQPRHRGWVRFSGCLIAVLALAASAILMVFSWTRLSPPIVAGTPGPGAVLLVIRQSSPPVSII